MQLRIEVVTVEFGKNLHMQQKKYFRKLRIKNIVQIRNPILRNRMPLEDPQLNIK